jgi:nucleoside 2-deoxyribosyltransferase
MIYVASIYSLNASTNSDRDVEIREKRYNYVLEKTADLMKVGSMVFSPIVHGHDMANKFNLPKNYEFFKEYDRHMIESSDCVIVLCMETNTGKTWKDSVGVFDEVSFATELGKPVVYLPCKDYFDPFETMAETLARHDMGTRAVTSNGPSLDDHIVEDEAVTFRYPSEE